MHLLDANVVITAHETYYPLDVVPEFWAWLLHHAKEGSIKMPIETYEEVLDGGKDTGKNPLYGYLQQPDIRAALLMKEGADVDLVRRVLRDGYADDLTDNEVAALGKDPFLIAHALANPTNNTVVTLEVSRPNKQRGNRKIPDVCKTLSIDCVDTFALTRALKFSTNWGK
jgi:hypothetical protein